MTPLKLLRKLGKLVRGGAGGRQIFLGCLLGVVIGMIPGFNLTLVLAILLLVILNANGGMFAVGLIVGKALCLLLAPITFGIGYAIIRSSTLEGFFRWASETPVLAWMDLHKFCLVGGLPVALVVGGVLGLLCTMIIFALRRAFMAATQKSEKVAKIGQNKLARFVLRVVFGKQKLTLAEMAEKKDPFFRKSGVIVAVVLLVIAVVVEFLLISPVFKGAIESLAGSAVGAEVDVADARLSLFGGELSMEGVQITDPDKPTHNMVFIEKLKGDISTRDLLARRFVIDTLHISIAQTDVPREAPGEVYREKERPEIEEAEKPEDALGGYLDIEKLKKYNRYLQKLADYLKQQREKAQPAEEPTPAEKEAAIAEGRKRGYLKLSAQELLTRRPAWTIRKLVVDKIVAGDTTYTAEGRELSSSPALNEAPMSISMKGSDGLDAELTLDFSAPAAAHSIAVHAPAVPLGDTFRLSEKAPVSVAGGTAKVDIAGTFSAESLNLPVELDISGLKARVREGRKVLGMDPDTAQEVFAGLSQIKLTALLHGSMKSPRVKIDDKQLLAGLKSSLIAAGKKELADRAGRELEKLQGKAAEEIHKVIKDNLGEDIQKAIPENLPGLKGLLGTGKDQQTKPEEEENEEAPAPKQKPEDKLKEKLEDEAKDVLKGLFD